MYAKRYFCFLADMWERINTFENLKILFRFCILPWHIILKVRFVHLIATGLTEGKRNREKTQRYLTFLCKWIAE